MSFIWCLHRSGGCGCRWQQDATLLSVRRHS